MVTLFKPCMPISQPSCNMPNRVLFQLKLHQHSECSCVACGSYNLMILPKSCVYVACKCSIAGNVMPVAVEHASYNLPKAMTQTAKAALLSGPASPTDLLQYPCSFITTCITWNVNNRACDQSHSKCLRTLRLSRPCACCIALKSVIQCIWGL